MTEFNVYCDESCHLESRLSKPLVLGSVYCKVEDRKTISDRIKAIKLDHKLTREFEIKWGKVSNSKLSFYKDIINYFFDTEKMSFRTLIVENKHELDHEKHAQTYDEFYYKMYFDMLKVIISPDNSYNIYLDIKDTRGYEKVEKLKSVIRTSRYDFSSNIINKIQEVRSDEVNIMQLTDLLIGAISYVHRNEKGSEAKLELIDLIRTRSKYSLLKSTLPTERKFNIFIWKPGYERR